MTQAAEIGSAAGRFSDARTIGLVSSAHFVSHVNFMVLPPLFAFIRADYGVSYAELGFALAAFNIVSTLLQPAAGFLVDRLAPRPLLIAALVLGASGFVVVGVLPFYWALVAGSVIAGIANTIYHPADYAILSETIGSGRVGQAFSLHTFFGMLGTAVTPVTMLFCADQWGWRGAVLCAAALGYGVALVLMMKKRALGDGINAPVAVRRAERTKVGWDKLLSRPILRNVLFFLLLAMAGAGISNFSIVALGALYGTRLAVANIALSAFLLMNALGVLAGGIVATRTERHASVAMAGFAASGAIVLAIALVPLGATALVLAMAATGFLSGIIAPSRDMIVRAVTPEGAFGTVFGFVTTGFSIGGSISPLLFGWLMDQNEPRLVFLMVVVFTAAALPLIRVRPATA